MGMHHFYATASHNSGIFVCPDNKIYRANITVVKNTYLNNFLGQTKRQCKPRALSHSKCPELGRSGV